MKNVQTSCSYVTWQLCSSATSEVILRGSNSTSNGKYNNYRIIAANALSIVFGNTHTCLELQPLCNIINIILRKLIIE